MKLASKYVTKRMTLAIRLENLHSQHDIIFLNFYDSLKTERTKQLYTHYLQKYYLSRPDNQKLTLEQIISKDHKKIEAELISILSEMKSKNLSYFTRQAFVSALNHFFTINDVSINKRKISRFVGEHTSKYEYRSYTPSEIASLLSILDERGKVAVLLMASTGMRIGALRDIKLKHLKKWTIDNQGNYIYQITVYPDSNRYKYTTFCTPEAAKAIDSYLELRKRYGENLKQNTNTDSDNGNGNWEPSNTPLFIKTFNKEKFPILDLKKIQTDTIYKYIILRLEETGIRTRMRLTESQCTELSYKEKQALSSTHRNELHPCHSLRIFAVTQMQRSKVDKTIREMLVGHSIGLDKVYYKPQDEEILQEYLKAVDLLTINNENRLKRQVDYYKQRENELSYMSKELAEIKEKLGI